MQSRFFRCDFQCNRISSYTWENAFANVLYLTQMHRREKIGGTEARTLEWRRMLHWNLIYGRDTPIACSTRNRECKSRARVRRRSQLIVIRGTSRTYREAKRTKKRIYVCARRKVSTTFRDTLLHLRLFSHLPHHLVADAPRSTRRQAPFRHRHNAIYNYSSQKECIIFLWADWCN